MIHRTPDPSCVKCGDAVPQDAGFCPNCGTQVHDSSFYTSGPATPETLLPAAPTAANAGGQTALPLAPTFGVGSAVTIGSTGIVTSLDNPSPRPHVAAGDGPFQAGQQINPRYTILKLLGTGGMGAVYQAFDHELGVAVAIKVIRPAAQSDATAAKELEQRFKRELVLARQVTHKYVVRIHDLGEISGIKYLTMPFVEGETLSQILRRVGKLPLARVIAIAQQVAQGLAAAHEKGVVHRDLKPENIMIESPSPMASADQGQHGRLEEGGDALIMDFGIARSVEGGATQTAAGSVIGTLDYMAPEQAQGKKVDQRADQYAFGLIVYDMLVGRQRLSSSDGAMAELFQRIGAAPPAPRTFNPEIPEVLNDIVMRCLQPSPSDRYPTTQDLVTVLDHLTPDGHVRSDVHEVIITRRRPLWQVAAAALAIVALAGSAGWYVSNRTNNNDMPTRSELGLDPISVLIADFDNRTGDPLFDGVIEQAVSLGIEGASFINAYPRRDALRVAATIKQGARLDEATAKLVALREGLGTVLVGDIEPRGSGYHIRIRGIGPGVDGLVRYSLEADAPGKAEVLATVGALAGQVRKALGDTEPAVTTDMFTAGSLEAASAYAQAQQLQALGRRPDALAKYEEAIRLDKEFGRAYVGAAVQYEALGRPAEAEKNFQQALSRIDRMTERERFQTRGLYYLSSKKPDLAAREFETLLQAYPFDSTGLANLALSHFYLRDLPQAIQIGRKALSVQPNNVGRRTNVALYAMYAGQYDEAISDSDNAKKLNAAALKAYIARAISELALGRTADAIKSYEELAKVSPDGASFAASGLADIAALEGRFADGIAILDKGIADDEVQKNLVRAAGKRVARGEMQFARGDAAAAARDAQLAAAVTDNTVRSAAALLLARGARRDEAQKIAESLEGRLEADFQAYGKLVRAEIALTKGQGRPALDFAREAEKLANTWLGHVTMARAYLLLDAFPETHAQLDVAIKRQGEATAMFLDDIPTYRYFPPIHYYVGRAQEGVKSAGAAQSYKTFLGFSKTGEGPLASDARARLAKLGS
jgi:serine/threonine protein kinase/tetratricopeptide (TPR) repeat protein